MKTGINAVLCKAAVSGRETRRFYDIPVFFWRELVDKHSVVVQSHKVIVQKSNILKM